jgi:hypothetical protein
MDLLPLKAGRDLPMLMPILMLDVTRNDLLFFSRDRQLP